MKHCMLTILAGLSATFVANAGPMEDYVARSKVIQCYMGTQQLRTEYQEFWLDQARAPTVEQANSFPKPITTGALIGVTLRSEGFDAACSKEAGDVEFSFTQNADGLSCKIKSGNSALVLPDMKCAAGD